MYILSNAIKNIRRNKKRNILIGLVVLILITLSTVSIVINNTTKGIINDYKGRFGSNVSIDFDIDKLMQLSNQEGETMFDNVTAEQYFNFAKSEYIKSATFQGSLPIDFLKDIKAVDEGKESENGSDDYIIVEDGGMGQEEMKITPTGNVVFVSEMDLLDDFKTGKRSIKEGKLFEEDNEAIISSDFAELNKLKVGDKISIQSNSHDKPEDVTISGVYLDLTSAYGGMPIVEPSINKRNEIIMDIDSSFVQGGIDSVMLVAKYELTSPEHLEAFKTEVISKGLPEIYKVTTDETTYNKIVAPVLGLKSITSNLTVIVLIVGCIILILIQALSIRERTYEIGVMRAMGLKKFRLARMFVYENLIITLICLCLGFGLGSAFAQPISNSMIESQVEIAKQNEQSGMVNNEIFVAGNGMGEGIVDAEPLSSIDVTISTDTILQMVLIALIIAVVSSLISVITITKHQPMQILSERE